MYLLTLSVPSCSVGPCLPSPSLHPELLSVPPVLLFPEYHVNGLINRVSAFPYLAKCACSGFTPGASWISAHSFLSWVGLQGLRGGFDLNHYYLVSPLFGMGVCGELEGTVFILWLFFCIFYRMIWERIMPRIEHIYILCIFFRRRNILINKVSSSERECGSLVWTAGPWVRPRTSEHLAHSSLQNNIRWCLKAGTLSSNLCPWSLANNKSMFLNRCLTLGRNSVFLIHTLKMCLSHELF